MLAAVAALCAFFSSAAVALAASPGAQYGSIGQYGEAFRGGGFDACWFDSGNYDGKGTGSNCTTNETFPKSGLFIDPVGFATDTKDPDPSGSATAIYVLDRTSALPATVAAANPTGVTTWRLQKLSATGTVLGVDEFSLPVAATGAGVTNLELSGLTVDPATGRVYSMVIGDDTALGGDVEITDEVVAWSTTPSGTSATTSQPALVPATSLPTMTDQAGLAGIRGYAAPGVLSNYSALLSAAGSKPFNGGPEVEQPTGIATTSGSSNVFIQADDPTTGSGSSGLVVISPTTGAPTSTFSSNAFTGLANDFADEDAAGGGAGIVGNSAGTLTWLDDQGSGTNTPEDFDVASVPASLATPTILASPANGATNSDGNTLDYDDAAIATNDVPQIASDDGTPLVATQTASPQVVALSNGLYASVFEPDQTNTPDPQNPLTTQASQSAAPSGPSGLFTPTTPGIRLLQPDGSGLLSENTAPLDTLFNTLGNTSATGPCALTDSTTATAGAQPFPSLAAGSGGAIWVLTKGQDSSGAASADAVYTGTGAASFEGGRQLIELSPGASTACPSASGTFTEAAPGQTAVTAGSSALTVTQGTTVSFDASGILYPGTQTSASTPSAAVAEYEWDFGDGSTPVATTDGPGPAFLNGPGYKWPAATQSHEYTKPGVYTVTMTLLGDYGTYDETGTVNVISNVAPVASFTASPSSTTTGTTVTFNGSASTPSPGDTLVRYQWNFGDGSQTTTTTATTTHAYATAGTYKVTLTVVDSDGQTSGTATQTETVTAPTTTTTTGPTTTTPPPPPPTPPTNAFTLGKPAAGKSGAFSTKLTFTDAGSVKIVATFKETIKVKVKSHGKTKTKTETKTVTFGSETASVSAGSPTETITPTKTAKSFLSKLSTKSSLTVSVSVTFTPTGGSALTHTSTIKIKGLKAPAKKKK